MLSMIHLSRQAIVLLFFVFLFGCCGTKDISSFPKKKLHESGPQQLIVENQTSRPLQLLSAGNGTSSKDIPPAGQFSIPFVVTTYVDTDDTGRTIDGSEFNQVTSPGTTQYFTPRADWHLRFMIGNDSWDYVFSFDDCWITGPAAPGMHKLEISGPPPLVPTELCP